MTPFFEVTDMKKIISLILAVMLMASPLYAAMTCTETVTEYPGSAVWVSLACTGATADNGTDDVDISDATMALIAGKYFLYAVYTRPTSGGTAPDAANVFVLDETTGEDYLGSADAGTTANKGANLIHATLPKSTMPYSYHMLNWFYFPIKGDLSVRVTGQATANANFTIDLNFQK
jgi:hypothetical protein